MARARVVPVDELIARNALREQGKDPAAQPEQHLQLATHNSQLQSQVEHLQEQLRAAKVSPRALKLTFDEICQRHGVEPAEELIKLANWRNAEGQLMLSAELRISIWKELLQYRTPKLRSVEMTGHVDHNLTINVVQFGSGKVMGTRTINLSQDAVEVKSEDAGA